MDDVKMCRAVGGRSPLLALYSYPSILKGVGRFAP